MSQKSEFEALLEEMGVLAKSTETSGDAAIAAAAGDTPAADTTAAGEAPEGEDGAGEGSEDTMGKSFTITLDDGTEVHAVDGAQLVKALTDRQEAFEKQVLAGMTVLTNMNKSLVEQVATLRKSAPARKSVLTVTEKPAPTAAAAAAEPTGVSPAEFMAKAMTLQTEGKLTGRQIAIAEQYLNIGQTPPADIVRAVLG